MRVIAGKYGGRKLRGPGKLELRPTSDQLRETLFNILGPSLEDSVFFDVYAGTGAIGIEAASRGAKEVYFVEKHPAAIRLIERNLKDLEIATLKPAMTMPKSDRAQSAVEVLGVGTGVEIIKGDAQRGLERLAARHLLADFIYLDPPYEQLYDQSNEYEPILEFLDSSHLIAPSGIVIVEHFWKTELPNRLERLELSRVKEQGDAALSFYRLALAA